MKPQELLDIVKEVYVNVVKENSNPLEVSFGDIKRVSNYPLFFCI